MAKIEYEKEILRYLFTSGKTTRTELAEGLGIRKNTVGDVCEALIDVGKIRETEDGRERNAKLELVPPPSSRSDSSTG